jgi:hypothetical protein
VIVADAGLATTAADMIRAQYEWAGWVPTPGRGPGPNRNGGSRVARGEWLVFVDDDCVPEPGFLRALETCRQRRDVDVIEGSIRIRDKVDSPFRRQPENVHGGVYWSGNLSIRREAFFRIGAFDEDYGQAACDDLDLAHRMQRGRLRAVFCPDAVVWHPSQRETLRGLIRRIWMSRWHLLFRLKTGASVPLDAPAPVALVNLAARQFVNEVRSTWHLISRHDPSQWKSRTFMQVWAWLVFPVQLPYLMLWELRFRRMLLARRGASARATAET